MAQAKTFDMTVFAAKVHCFKGFPRIPLEIWRSFLLRTALRWFQRSLRRASPSLIMKARAVTFLISLVLVMNKFVFKILLNN